MALGAVFLFNVLCALVPCDPIRQSTNSFISWEKARSDELDGIRIDEDNVDFKYPVVGTKNGFIQGYSMGSIEGKRFFAFEGIRYAESPTGHNRFKSPVPAKPWNGILKAFKTGPDCLQGHASKLFRVVGNEDCLFLNVYSPNVAKNITKPLETIIWIHGGSFVFGSGAEFGPTYFLDRDVILVTINYRLGVLGFMSTGDEFSPGNWGLKDQRLAIKWVYDNIKSFGGSPENINLMGQSAGGVSVHLHLLGKESRNYFKSAISLSGTAFIYWTVQTKEKALSWTHRIAEVVKCPNTGDNEELVNCLKSVNPSLLVGAQIQIFDWPPFPPVLFGPTVEPKTVKDAFLDDTPDELYSQNKVANLPYICTTLSDEGVLFNNIAKVTQRYFKIANNLEKYLPFVFEYSYLSRKRTNEVTRRILEYYFNGKPRNKISDKELFEAFRNIASDRYFYFGVLKALRAHSQIAPVFSYFFDYKGKYNLGETLGAWEDELGVPHGTDQFYFYNSTFYIDAIRAEDKEYKLTKILIDFVINFIEKGKPLHTAENGDLVNVWNPINKDKHGFDLLQISKDIKMIKFPFIERVKFWESLELPDSTPLRHLNFTF